MFNLQTELSAGVINYSLAAQIPDPSTFLHTAQTLARTQCWRDQLLISSSDTRPIDILAHRANPRAHGLRRSHSSPVQIMHSCFGFDLLLNLGGLALWSERQVSNR